MGFNVGGGSSYQNTDTNNNNAVNNQVYNRDTGTSSGTSSAFQSGSQAGTSTALQSGSQTGTATTTSTPLVTQGWQGANTALLSNLGSTGLTPEQRHALTNLISWQGNPANATSTIAATQPQLQSIANRAPSVAWNPEDVTARTGASMMEAYRNPYEDQVVASTLSDLEKAYGKTQNDLRAQYGGQGWSPTAGSPAGLQVAAAEAADDYLRTVGSTAGALRKAGFDTAAQYGTQDAGRKLAADTTNAGTDATLSMFNAGQGDRASDRSLSALDAIVRNAATGNAIGSASNQQIYDMAGGGNENLLAYLGAQAPAFGTSSTGATTGSNFGSTTGQTTGQSTGSTTGSTSGQTQNITDTINNLQAWSSGKVMGSGKENTSSFGK